MAVFKLETCQNLGRSGLTPRSMLFQWSSGALSKLLTSLQFKDSLFQNWLSPAKTRQLVDRMRHKARGCLVLSVLC